MSCGIQTPSKTHTLKEAYHKWHSPILDREAEMLVFGHSGRPVVVFPTSLGKYYEAKDMGLIQSVEWFVANGDIKIYCPSGIDEYSWYNKAIAPAARAYNHILYDQFVLEEVLGRALYETGWHTAAMAGCSFGGYHAANFAFRHPDKTNALLSMSGVFDIRTQVDGYYDDNIYYNNPVDFLPNDYNPALWNFKIILGTTTEDICLEQSKILASILNDKEIPHWLDIRNNAPHDWPIWLEMFPHYISTL